MHGDGLRPRVIRDAGRINLGCGGVLRIQALRATIISLPIACPIFPSQRPADPLGTCEQRRHPVRTTAGKSTIWHTMLRFFSCATCLISSLTFSTRRGSLLAQNLISLTLCHMLKIIQELEKWFSSEEHNSVYVLPGNGYVLWSACPVIVYDHPACFR